MIRLAQGDKVKKVRIFRAWFSQYLQIPKYQFHQPMGSLIKDPVIISMYKYVTWMHQTAISRVAPCGINGCDVPRILRPPLPKIREVSSNGRQGLIRREVLMCQYLHSVGECDWRERTHSVNEDGANNGWAMQAIA